jgi:uncharacterized protein YcbK (DUF882 family)
MTKISENFRLQEFDSSCGREMPLKVQKNVIQLGQNLQVLRDYLKASITINSGYRSPQLNRKIKGATRSQHLLGTAADIVVRGHTPKQVADAIELLISQGKMREGGLKAYGTFTHYDIRGTKARW